MTREWFQRRGQLLRRGKDHHGDDQNRNNHPAPIHQEGTEFFQKTFCRHFSSLLLGLFTNKKTNVYLHRILEKPLDLVNPFLGFPRDF